MTAAKDHRATLDRRQLLKGLAAVSGALIVGFDPSRRSWITAAEAQQGNAKRIPKLDGWLLFDDANRQAFSWDNGHGVQRIPWAVLKPRSVGDVVKMVKYANQYHLKIGMRGDGHSLYGQSLVEAGVLIDSRTLTDVKMVGKESVDIQPGANWGHVNEVTLPNHRTPLVMPAVMTVTTVGGILSVGGFGETAHRFGGIVDTVQELDVVTGDGRLVTCSPKRERELFEMTLAGLGQCGILVRARVGLMPFPQYVVSQEFFYDAVDDYLHDASAAVREAKFDFTYGGVFPKPGGGWRYMLKVGMGTDKPESADFTKLTSTLKSVDKKDVARADYIDYILRNLKKEGPQQRPGGFRVNAWVPAEKNNVLAHQQTGRFPPGIRGVFLSMVVPASEAKAMLTDILAHPTYTHGTELFSVNPLNTTKFTRPLFRIPKKDDTAFILWVFRTVSMDAAAYADVIATNTEMHKKMRAAGGHVYPPHGGYYTPADWQAHFGDEVWKRLVAAKKKYDPNKVLTPGPNMFS